METHVAAAVVITTSRKLSKIRAKRSFLRLQADCRQEFRILLGEFQADGKTMAFGLQMNLIGPFEQGAQAITDGVCRLFEYAFNVEIAHAQWKWAKVADVIEAMEAVKANAN